MERVFITGRGLITPLGDGLKANEEALREGRSGISNIQGMVETKLSSNVGGMPNYTPDTDDLIDRKKLRFCPPVAVMAIAAAAEALEEAGISREDIPNLRIAVVLTACHLQEFPHHHDETEEHHCSENVFIGKERGEHYRRESYTRKCPLDKIVHIGSRLIYKGRLSLSCFCGCFYCFGKLFWILRNHFPRLCTCSRAEDSFKIVCKDNFFIQ